MRIRPAPILLAAAALVLSGCALVTGVGKVTGIISAPRFEIGSQMPPDFRLVISVRDAADPPIDYEFDFDRSGKVTYDVNVRVPRRKQQDGTFEINEDQVRALWKSITEARFDTIEPRHPESGVGPDLRSGVQKFFVRADGLERRVESHFQDPAVLRQIRVVAMSLVPPEVMSASGAPGGPRDRPKEFVADTTTRLFHRPDCALLKDVAPERRQPFASEFDALNFQFEPCPECKPLPAK